MAEARLELPGIQIEGEIGRGGMARVFLGTQIKFGRQVAVKFVSPTFTDDTQFSERFLAESRINAQLTHPNIVQVYDFGKDARGLYLVMEYLPGGDLNDRLQSGLHMQGLIKVVKDMGRALDYAHSKDIVHRDIKPENILFRDDGSAVLTDFGIAKFVIGEQANMTRHGTVVGTPQYMSPEQAAGRPIDGRSDLYSLGIVFFRMLTGDVPYKADTAVAIGIKHLQEPIPRLPTFLAAFQPVIDKALAKRPEQRFQSGAEFAQALDRVRSFTSVPNNTIKTQAIDTQEIMAVGIGDDLLSTPRDSARAERQSARSRRRRWRALVATVLLLGVLGAGGYYAVEEGLVSVEEILAQVGIGEDPALIAAWSEAQSLRQDPNQGLASIVAAYRRVLGIDPDHEGAQAQVATLASDWKASIDEALLQGNLELARTRLDESSSVFAQDADLDLLNVRLLNRQRAEQLLVSTQALLSSHGLSDLPSATAAIQAYQEVLRLAPGHVAATQALDELAIHYAGLATASVSQGDVNGAITLLERATAANPLLTDLDDVRKRISQVTTAQAAIDELLQQARRYRADNRLIDPPGENAAELYHRVLATDPGNVVAAQGLDEVAAQVSANADQLLIAGDLQAIEQLVTQATAAGIGEDNVAQIRDRLESEQTRQQRIAENLALAGELIRQGFLTAPVEDNAVARLREVQQIDPGNAAAAGLLRQCAQRLASVAIEAHEFGMVTEAKQYLDLALTITPEVEQWVALRDSWEA